MWRVTLSVYPGLKTTWCRGSVEVLKKGVRKAFLLI